MYVVGGSYPSNRFVRWRGIPRYARDSQALRCRQSRSVWFSALIIIELFNSPCNEIESWYAFGWKGKSCVFVKRYGVMYDQEGRQDSGPSWRS